MHLSLGFLVLLLLQSVISTCTIDNSNRVVSTFPISDPRNGATIGSGTAYYDSNQLVVSWNMNSGWCVKETNIFGGSQGGQNFTNNDEGCTAKGSRSLEATSSSINEFAATFVVEESAVLPIGKTLKGTFSVTYPGSPSTRPDDPDPNHKSYFNARFTNEPGTPSNPWILDANCVDLFVTITPKKQYSNAKVLSFLDQSIPIPKENINNLSWLANQDLSGDLYDTFPTANFNDIQTAYWIIIHGRSKTASKVTISPVADDIANAALDSDNNDFRPPPTGWDSVVIQINDGAVQDVIVHIPESESKAFTGTTSETRFPVYTISGTVDSRCTGLGVSDVTARLRRAGGSVVGSSEVTDSSGNYAYPILSDCSSATASNTAGGTFHCMRQKVATIVIIIKRLVIIIGK
jgi:hypothetical protein